MSRYREGVGGIESCWRPIFCRSLTLCFWPDSEPSKLLDHLKQNPRKGGASDRQSPFTGQFFRWRHFALVSIVNQSLSVNKNTQHSHLVYGCSSAGLHHAKDEPSNQRPNSWTKSLLLTVTSTDLPWDLYLLKFTQPLNVSTVSFLYTVKEKGGKPDRKPYPLPYELGNA